MFALLFLGLCSTLPKIDCRVEDRVDIIEVNHFFRFQRPVDIQPAYFVGVSRRLSCCGILENNSSWRYESYSNPHVYWRIYSCLLGYWWKQQSLGVDKNYSGTDLLGNLDSIRPGSRASKYSTSLLEEGLVATSAPAPNCEPIEVDLVEMDVHLVTAHNYVQQINDWIQIGSWPLTGEYKVIWNGQNYVTEIVTLGRLKKIHSRVFRYSYSL